MGCGSKEPKIIGAYTESRDISGIALIEGEKWLSDAWMSDNISVSDYISDITVSLNVILYSDGTYKYELDEESLKTASEKADQGLADALTALIIVRFNAAGKGDYTSEMIEELMVESLGMTAVDYVKKYGPELVPSLDVLKADLEVTGSYKIEE